MTVHRDYMEALPPGEATWVAGGAGSDQVAALEAALRFALPASYRSFLTSVGAAAIGDSYVSGIIDNDPMSLGGGSLLGDTIQARQEQHLPSHLLVIQADGDAPYCLDTSDASSGEYPVVCFEVSTMACTRIAGSFDEWFFTYFVVRA